MVLESQCPLAVGDSWGSSAPFDAKLVIFYFCDVTATSVLPAILFAP